MTAAALIDQAVASVLTGPLADFRAGRIDRDELDKYVQRRAGAIKAAVLELQQQPKAASFCAECRAAATTAIGGMAYCDHHAAAAPRLAVPVKR